jgi:uncharacterized membrane protein YphA (DoxX/SURF4 family)
MFEKGILKVYSIIIGVLFIISGLGKVIDTSGFSNLINQYGLGYLMILSPVIVVFEILLGLFLVLLINPKFYAMISFGLLTIFTALFAFAHFKYGVNNCGCFGTTQHINLPPIFSFIRNFILIGMSLIVWIKYPKEKKIKLGISKHGVGELKLAYINSNWKKYLVLIVMSISIFTAGFTYKTPYFLKSKPEIHEFQGQNIKNTELSKYLTTSPDSTYLFFCFSYTCPYCWNSIENLRQYQKSGTVDRTDVVAIGAENDKDVFIQNFKPDFNIKDLPAIEMDKLTDSYPTAFYVEHDTVKFVLQSELPSPFIFKKLYIDNLK